MYNDKCIQPDAMYKASNVDHAHLKQSCYLKIYTYFSSTWKNLQRLRIPLKKKDNCALCISFHNLREKKLLINLKNWDTLHSSVLGVFKIV